MNHEQAREALPLYADDELAPQRAAELERCLAESTELRDELERWRGLRRCANRVVTATVVPSNLESRILADLRRASSGTRYRALRWAGGMTAIAAAAVLMFALWQPTPASAEPRLLAADDFAQTYLHCAVEHRHREVDVDLHDVHAAHAKLTELEARPVLVPDLGEAGFELDGVCRCFHVPGVEVVHVFYRRGGPEPAVVSCFTVDQKVRLKGCGHGTCVVVDGQRREYETASSENVAVCKWDEFKRSFAVCGQMEHARLRELVDGVKVVSLRESPMIVVRVD